MRKAFSALALSSERPRSARALLGFSQGFGPTPAGRRDAAGLHALVDPGPDLGGFARVAERLRSNGRLPLEGAFRHPEAHGIVAHQVGPCLFGLGARVARFTCHREPPPMSR